MISNKSVTLVFSSYQSGALLKKVIKKLPNSYKILVIENSLNKKIKNILEKSFKNVEVIIPKENLGLARSYNLGIKKAKTKYVFLNNPDLEIKNTDIAEELALPPVKIHCSVLAEDAIKAALADLQGKQESEGTWTPK